MPSLLLKLADLGFTAHGCYRTGDCDKCAAKNLLTWFWHSKCVCDNRVLEWLQANQLIVDLPAVVERYFFADYWSVNAPPYGSESATVTFTAPGKADHENT